MAIREKLRKKFSRGSSSTSGSSSENSSTLGDDSDPKWIVYGPGEKIPYKYRRPVEKAHKDKLESYSFATAWSNRRKSFSSQYSPFGSRLPSRRNSVELQMGRRSMHLHRGDAGDLAEGSDEESTLANVGMSRRNSHHRNNRVHKDDSGHLTPGDALYARPPSRHETPFTAEDLTLALQRSRLDVPA